MSEQSGFFSELLYRRVPQYLGLYIAAVWMAIEIGEWLTDQFTLPARLTAYIFVFMATLLPSIALFAWTHGAPGKDTSTTLEKIFITANVVIAAVAVVLVPERGVGQENAVAATASEQTVQVSRDSSQRILVFFAPNNTADAPDWFAYALPFLISQDIDRASSRIGAVSPFSIGYAMERMRQSGFDRGTGEPLTLQLDLAGEMRFNFLMRSTLRDADDGQSMVFDYALHDAISGQVLIDGEETFVEETMLATVDKISAAAQQVLRDQFDTPPTLTDVPVAETMSPSTEAIERYIQSRITGDIDQDLAAWGAPLAEATEVDPQFAEAYALLGIFHFQNGDRPSAEIALDNALQYDFRLSTESRFQVRINREAVRQQWGEAIKIARAWTRVEPDNEFAFYRLAAMEERQTSNLDAALAALKRVREINPSADDVLLRMANIEIQRGNLDAAAAYAEEYANARPESADGQSKLAEIYAAKGDYDQAIEAFEGAGYRDSNSISPALGIISVLMRKGEFANATDRLATLLDSELTDEERIRVVTVGVQLASLQGRYSDAVQMMVDADDAARRTLPPLFYTMQLEAPAIMMRAYAGEDVDQVMRELVALREGLQPPFDSFARWYEASVLIAAGRKDEYIDAFNAAAEYFQGQPENETMRILLLSGQAQIAIFEGDNDTAREAVEEAIEISESSFLNVLSASESLGMRATMYDLLRQAGETEAAILGLKKVVNEFPGLAMAYMFLAEAYLSAGERGMAQDAASRAEDLWTDADDAFVYLPKLEKLLAELRGA
ncbi:MAG: tetratricopeptide repeat protein [Pseudomonadota bacterium]